MSVLRVLAVVGVLTALAAVAPAQVAVKPAPAQPPGTSALGNPVLDFVKDKGVQKDLQLTPEQLAKLDELARKQAEMIRDLAGKPDLQKLKELTEASKKGVAGVLTEEQAKRVDQLMLQASGPIAFFTPKVQ